jgi:hypothetical protein
MLLLNDLDGHLGLEGVVTLVSKVLVNASTTHELIIQILLVRIDASQALILLANLSNK